MTSTCNPSGFWAFLEPVAEPRSLFELAIEKGVGKDGKGQPAIIGVDANSWILRCKGDRAVPSCVPTWSRKAIHGRLFLRLAWLLRIPATPLFLFDSDQAPVASRDEDRTRWGDELVQEFIALLDAFGYAWFKTRGDAAAELGRLQRSGHIHLVLSDDASALLFGATCVVRTPLDVAASDECSVLIYRSENMARLRIDQTDLIFVALLCGGKHGKGFVGIKPDFARKLARHNGLGDGLVALAKLPKGENANAYAQWSMLFRSVLRNYATTFGGSPNLVTTNLPTSFPDLALVLAYATPATQWDVPVPVFGGSLRPSLGRLMDLCIRAYGWKTFDDVVKPFRQHIWPGICLQAMLYSAQNAESMRPGHLYFVEETPFLFFFLDRVHERALRWESIPAYRVDFDTVDLFAGVRSIIKDSGDTIDPGNDAPCTVWVPCVLLRMACPLRVGEMP